MGTRWICHVHEGNIESDIISTIYGQFDGYPSGAGNDIKAAFEGRKLVNGIPGDRGKYVNGMGCATALLVGHLKNGEAGGIYVYKAGTKDVWEDYEYHLYDGGGRIFMKIGDSLFDGPIDEFDAEKVEESDE